MKKTRLRSFVVIIIGICFLVGMSFFIFKYVTQSSTWAMNSINGHISGEGLASAGKIMDRDNIILAQSLDGKRVYNENKSVRSALLHTIGDENNYISTSIQSTYSPQLLGYNIITGFGLPKAISFSRDIKLTIDSELCRISSEKLGRQKGAVTVYNYITGEIVCMVSSPNYDVYNKPDLNNDTQGDYDGVYLNRALSSSFTPGSVFKVVTAVSAINNISNIEDRKFTCKGHIEVDGEKITCLEKHGSINLKDGMAKSCNIVFAELAMELGADKMTATAEELGFNKSLKVDKNLTGKSEYNVAGARNVDVGWSGIGQYNDLVNPIHLMTIMGAIANNGVYTEPYMVSSIVSSFLPSVFNSTSSESKRILSESTANKLKDIMRYTVKTHYGDYRFPNLTVAAKTGTGEVGKGKKANGWIAGFSLDKDCPLAFAVVVENSGYGISTAAPIASAVMAEAAKRLK